MVNIAIYLQRELMLAKCFWPQLISWTWLLETCNEFHRGMFVRLEYRMKKKNHFLMIFRSFRSCHLQCKIAFYFWAATFCANNRVLFPDHEEKLGFRRLYYCKMGFFLITDNTDKCTIDETSTMLDSVTSANLFFFYPFHSTRRSSFYLYVASSSTTQSTMTVSCKQKF